MGKGLEYTAKAGDIYTSDEGNVYRVVGYQPSPTVILERLTELECCFGHPRETHAVGCRNAERFTRLKPVGEEE